MEKTSIIKKTEVVKMDSVTELIKAIPEITMFLLPYLIIFCISLWIVVFNLDYLLMRKKLKEKRIGYWKFLYYWIFHSAI